VNSNTPSPADFIAQAGYSGPVVVFSFPLFKVHSFNFLRPLHNLHFCFFLDLGLCAWAFHLSLSIKDSNETYPLIPPLFNSPPLTSAAAMVARHGRGRARSKNRSSSSHDRKRSPESTRRSALLLDDSSTFILADDDANPRSFPFSVKQQCWEKAEKVKGRDPDRWRRDALGNIVFRKLVGCPGCLCHDYDHITPYSKVPLLFLLLQ
jgi:hypothetical protein